MPLSANSIDILTPRVAELDYAVRGFPFTDASQAGIIGLREEAKLNVDAVVRVDAIGREQTDAYLGKLDVTHWATTYAAVKRQMLLTQVLQQLRFKIGTNWWNFLDNTATPPFGTPNGSVVMGCETTYEVTSTTTDLKAAYQGKMHPKEFDWLLSHATASQTGGSGGTYVSGLTAAAYDQTEYGFPGIEKIYVGTGDTSTDDELGLEEAQSTKIGIKFAKTHETTRMQPIVRMCEVTNEYGMMQDTYTYWQSIANRRNSDFVITIQLWSGVTLVFNHSTSLVPKGSELSDKTTLLKLSSLGKIPFDPLNGTPANIIFDDANSKITFNRSGYV